MYINRSKYHVNHMLITSVVPVQFINYVNQFLKVLSLLLSKLNPAISQCFFIRMGAK